MQLIWIFFGEILRLTEIVVRIVELPLIFTELRRRSGDIPWNAMPGHRGPAVMIDPAIAKHLKVLSRMGCRRFSIGKGVFHAYSFHRFLLDAVDGLRLRQFCRHQDCRCDIDDVMPLGANAAGVLDPRGP